MLQFRSPDIGIDKLKELRKKETDAKARDRLLAYVYRKEADHISSDLTMRHF